MRLKITKLVNSLLLLDLIKQSICEEQTEDTFKTCVYYSSWSYYQDHLPSDLPIDHITNLFFAFPKVQPKSYDLYFDDCDIATTIPIELRNYHGSNDTIYSVGLMGQFNQLKTINPNLKISLSIGGSNTGALFIKIVDDPEKLANFLQQIKNLVIFFRFDGIDLDWEFPKNKLEGKKLTMFVDALRSMLDSIDLEDHYLLSIAIPAEPEFIDYLDFDYDTGIDSHIDFYNIMGYDLSGAWSKRINYHSNLYPSLQSRGVDQTVKHLIESVGIDSRKLVLGMPNYAKTFKLAHPPKVDEMVSIDELIGMKAQKSCESPFSSDAEVDKEDKRECIIDYKIISQDLEKCDFYYYDNDAVGSLCYNVEEGTVVVFDDPKVAHTKGQYVKDMKLAGGMFWDSKGDDFESADSSLLLNFIEGLGGINSLVHNQESDNTYVFSSLKNYTYEEKSRGWVSLWDLIFNDACCNSRGYRSYCNDRDFFDMYHPPLVSTPNHIGNNSESPSNSDTLHTSISNSMKWSPCLLGSMVTLTILITLV